MEGTRPETVGVGGGGVGGSLAGTGGTLGGTGGSLAGAGGGLAGAGTGGSSSSTGGAGGAAVCDPNPCEHDGKCVLGPAGRTCNCASAWTGAVCELPRFEGLGYIGSPSSQATAISADGQVAVGYVWYKSQAFRWTKASGMVGLGYFPMSDFGSSALATNANGSVIVGGATYHDCSSCDQRPFRWESSTGMEYMGALPDRRNGYATGISADGSIVVGYGSDNTSLIDRAFRWTRTTGMVPMGDGAPKAISADGRVIVGDATDGKNFEATRWTAQGSFGLGKLRSDDSSSAHATNADGSVVVGSSSTAGAGHAFRWTERSGMVSLDTLQGDHWSCAYGTSADGSVVVGTSSEYESGAGSQGHAVVWDAPHGMRRLDSILLELGVDLGGWMLVLVSGVSADGKVMTGWGTNLQMITEAWIARLP